MNIIELREFCLALKGVEECLPFDNKTLVFKVKGKMFLLTNLEGFESMNVKCDPEKAIDLRERFTEIQPGYHMNKKHWNTVHFEGTLTDKQLYNFVSDSYDLVVSKLTKKLQLELNK